MSIMCNFATWFSLLVGTELEEARLLDHQSRETTWTDRMLLELKKLRDPRILALSSNEKATGGDMDWWFVNPASNASFCLTVQAKILHYLQRNPDLWHYEEIAHPRDDPGRQSRTLVQYARDQCGAGFGYYPYYIFYNPSSAPAIPSRTAWPGEAVTLVDGFVVADHISTHITASGLPIPAKRYSALVDRMVSLPEFLCSCVTGIPSPEEIVERINDLRDEIRFGDEADVEPDPFRARVSDALPFPISRMVERRTRYTDHAEDIIVLRDTVVFVSGD
jgi:hypothetical protein